MENKKKGPFIYKLTKTSRKLDIDDDANLIRRFNSPLIADRAIQEFQGMASVIIYDGIVDDNEIEIIISWLEKHQEFCDQWPLSELWNLLHDILEDGIITSDERKGLLSFLSSVAGSTRDDQTVVSNIFTENITPEFNDKAFLFTGKLQFGTRKKAQAAVADRGGICLKSYNSHKLDYLVVGLLGQDAWKFSRFGRKIESCINDIENGSTSAAIIKEKTFIEAIIRTS
jgi:hypothetical protein